MFTPACLFMVSCCAAAAAADHVVTTSGVRYDGTITYFNKDWVVIRLDSGDEKAFARSDVSEIEPLKMIAPAPATPAAPPSGPAPTTPAPKPAPAPTKSADSPKPAPEPADPPAPPAPDGEAAQWALLGRNMSDANSRSGTLTKRKPDRGALRKLCNSQIEPIRSLARARAAQDLLYERVLQGKETDRTTQELRDEWFGKLGATVPGALAGVDPGLITAAESYTSPAVLFRASAGPVREGKMLWLGVLGEKALRDELVRALEGRERGTTLSDGGVRTAFKCVRNTQEAVISARNGSKATLHHCFVFARLDVDRAKIAMAWKDPMRFLPSQLVLSNVDMDVQTLMSAWGDTMRWAYAAVDRGSVVYIDSLAPGAGVEVGLAPLLSLMVVGGSASIQVFADEGAATVSLSIPDMQQAALGEFARWSKERR